VSVSLRLTPAHPLVARSQGGMISVPKRDEFAADSCTFGETSQYFCTVPGAMPHLPTITGGGLAVVGIDEEYNSLHTGYSGDWQGRLDD
jgi:hypothetical protein